MAVKKIKLNEVAKALHLENKKVIAMLGDFVEEPKKATSALTEGAGHLKMKRTTHCREKCDYLAAPRNTPR